MTVSASGGPLSERNPRYPVGQVNILAVAEKFAPGVVYEELKALLAELASCRAVLTQHEEALRAIAEGNLGGEPWQADYARIRQVARAALEVQA